MAAGVSVVIPHFGDPALAESVARTLQAQATSRELQIIVADDHSPIPFGTLPGVTVTRRSSNGGYGAAANAGAALAVHPWLLILNSDVDFDASFVEQFVSLAESHEPGCFGPGIAWGETSLPPSHAFPRPWNVLMEHSFALSRWRDTTWGRWLRGYLDPGPAEARVVGWVSGAALLVRKEHFDAVGGFDETFFLFFEEVDLQWRLHRHGVPAVILPRTLLRHGGGGSISSEQARREALISDLRYARRRGRDRRHLMVHLAVATVDFAYDLGRRLRGQRVAPRQRWRGRVDGLLTAWRTSGQDGPVRAVS